MSKPLETVITKYAQTAVTIASGDSTQIGGDIPTDKVRYVTKVLISAAASQQLEIMLGHDSDHDNETLMVCNLTQDTVYELGSGDPEKPLFVCRPQVAAGGSTITKNRLGIAHETSAIDCNFTYFDA